MERTDLGRTIYISPALIRYTQGFITFFVFNKDLHGIDDCDIGVMGLSDINKINSNS